MFAFAMATLGALLGFWIAISASPLVMTALPLLFGVAGGWGGLSLVKMDLSKPGTQKKIALLAGALASLCSSCLLSTLVTLAFLPTLRSFTAVKADIVDVQYHPDPVAAVAMRAKLAALGASPDEQRAILFAAFAPPDYGKVVKQFNQAAKTYTNAFEAFSDEQKKALETDDIVSRMLLESYAASKAMIAEIDALHNKYDDQTIARLMQLRIESLSYFDGASTSEVAENIARKNPAFLAARAEMYANIMPIKSGSLTARNMANQPAIDEAVRLLEAKLRVQQLQQSSADGLPFPGKIVAKVDDPRWQSLN